MNLKELGFTQEELQNRVIEKIASDMLETMVVDEDGNPSPDSSAFHQKLEKIIKERIDASIREVAEKEVLPNVTKYIEELTLTETNRWGEKQSKPITFIEYLVARCDAYMREEVDYQGKSKEQNGNSYGWRGTQTRVAHLIHEHLHYSISRAMEEALKNVTGSISKALGETAKIKLQEAVESLKVTTHIKS